MIRDWTLSGKTKKKEKEKSSPKKDVSISHEKVNHYVWAAGMTSKPNKERRTGGNGKAPKSGINSCVSED